MINSLNATINDTQLDVFMQELEERDEMVCFFNGCGIAANPCIGQACGIACFGVTICPIGAHAFY